VSALRAADSGRDRSVTPVVKPLDRWHQLHAAVKLSNLPPADRHVFLDRLGHSTYGTAEMTAEYTRTQEKVAKETGLSLRQVKYSEAHLARHGWLKVTRAAEGDRRRREYAFAIGTQCDCTGRRHEPGKAQPASAPVAPIKVQPIGATPHVNGQIRGRDINEGKGFERRISEADLLAMTPARGCELCGAERDDEAGFIRHDPDCWHAQAMALYASER